MEREGNGGEQEVKGKKHIPRLTSGGQKLEESMLLMKMSVHCTHTLMGLRTLKFHTSSLRGLALLSDHKTKKQTKNKTCN